MGISIFKRAPTKAEQIDIQTAFNIWNTLEVRYRSIQTNEVLQNFIHDQELLVASDLLVSHFKQQVKVLEKEGAKFELKMPTRPPEETKFSVRVNAITDKYIYNQMIADLIAEMYSLSRSVRTTLSHDSLRSIFQDFSSIAYY